MIGHGAVVAAGAVVTTDVPDFAILAGVPACGLRMHFAPEACARLPALARRDWPHDRRRAALEDSRSPGAAAFLGRHGGQSAPTVSVTRAPGNRARPCSTGTPSGPMFTASDRSTGLPGVTRRCPPRIGSAATAVIRVTARGTVPEGQDVPVRPHPPPDAAVRGRRRHEDPRPRRAWTAPRSASAASARRTLWRFTPKRAARAASAGIRAPDGESLAASVASMRAQIVPGAVSPVIVS